MNNKKSGFTLIELMIVVAIIAILTAIAIPAYKRYVIGSQIADGLSLMDGAKTTLSEYYANHGVMPTDNEEAGLAASASITGNYVTDTGIIYAGNGVIAAKFGGKANSVLAGKYLTLSPIVNSGSISWVCGGSTAVSPKVDNQYLPSSCRSP